MWLVLAVGSVGSRAQGTFQNLDFEAASLPSVPAGQSGGLVPIGSSLPGWTASRGTLSGPVSITQVLHNNYTLSQPNVSILGPVWADPLFGGVSIIEGQYTALVQAGSAGGNLFSSSIAQVGTVPIGALYVEMKVDDNASGGSAYFAVSFAGQNIAMNPIGAGPHYTLYGGNISGFAGQSGELRFTALPLGNASTTIGLDSIVFSTVPEPGTWALLWLGGALLWCATRRHRN